MPTTRPNHSSRRTRKSFRVGMVRAYLRGKVWYLCYHEGGQRRQPRVGLDRETARQMAAEINAQLERGLPSALGFQPISVAELPLQWLDHHEHVRRSSVRTVERYRAATNHLLRFIANVRPVRRVSEFCPRHAEEFVRYLRSLKVAPNGHRNAVKRRLRDNSVKYILETCSTMLNYAHRHRHLSPYAENPFRTIEIGRVPVEDAKPITVFSPEQERRFFEACDDWQFPLFLLLLVTGVRPGELTHLLLPEDLDLEDRWLPIRNKPALGWRIKSRNERDVPLHPVLVDELGEWLQGRQAGPLFCQRRCDDGFVSPLAGYRATELECEAAQRIANQEMNSCAELNRRQRKKLLRRVWRDAGAIREDWVRIEFMRVTKAIGWPYITAPKTFRHTFATLLQDANVDPPIGNELMGHSSANSFGSVLGTTGLYTHTQPETKRRQLELALQNRPALACAKDWLARRHRTPA